MKPISLEVKKNISLTAKEICLKIAEVENWNDFNGYAMLPGIEKAEYEHQMDEMIGSRISVLNSDGSQHIEEILEWEDGKRILMKLHKFSPPLSKFSTHFIEEWDFVSAKKNKTIVMRKFQIFPKSFLTRPFMWFISVFFKKAIIIHMDEMEKEAKKTLKS